MQNFKAYVPVSRVPLVYYADMDKYDHTQHQWSQYPIKTCKTFGIL